MGLLNSHPSNNNNNQQASAAKNIINNTNNNSNNQNNKQHLNPQRSNPSDSNNYKVGIEKSSGRINNIEANNLTTPTKPSDNNKQTTSNSSNSNPTPNQSTRYKSNNSSGKLIILSNSNKTHLSNSNNNTHKHHNKHNLRPMNSNNAYDSAYNEIPIDDSSNQLNNNYNKSNILANLDQEISSSDNNDNTSNSLSSPLSAKQTIQQRSKHHRRSKRKSNNANSNNNANSSNNSVKSGSKRKLEKYKYQSNINNTANNSNDKTPPDTTEDDNNSTNNDILCYPIHIDNSNNDLINDITNPIHNIKTNNTSEIDNNSAFTSNSSNSKDNKVRKLTRYNNMNYIFNKILNTPIRSTNFIESNNGNDITNNRQGELSPINDLIILDHNNKDENSLANTPYPLAPVELQPINNPNNNNSNGSNHSHNNSSDMSSRHLHDSSIDSSCDNSIINSNLNTNTFDDEISLPRFHQQIDEELDQFTNLPIIFANHYNTNNATVSTKGINPNEITNKAKATVVVDEPGAGIIDNADINSDYDNSGESFDGIDTFGVDNELQNPTNTSNTGYYFQPLSPIKSSYHNMVNGNTTTTTPVHHNSTNSIRVQRTLIPRIHIPHIVNNNNYSRPATALTDLYFHSNPDINSGNNISGSSKPTHNLNNNSIEYIANELPAQVRDLLKSGQTRIPTSLLAPRLLLYLSNNGYLPPCVDGHFPQYVNAEHLNAFAQFIENQTNGNKNNNDTQTTNNINSLSTSGNMSRTDKIRYDYASFRRDLANSDRTNFQSQPHSPISHLLAENSLIALKQSQSKAIVPVTSATSPANIVINTSGISSGATVSSPIPPPPLPAALQKSTMRIAEQIRKLYSLLSEERGHRTIGHACVTHEDQLLAAESKCDLLYGEVLPEGASRMFDTEHLDLSTASSLYDLGSGLGKLAIQAFLQFPNLDYICGVELARSRCKKGFEAMKKLSKARHSAFNAQIQEASDGLSCKLIENSQMKNNTINNLTTGSGRITRAKKRLRSLHLYSGDLFTITEAFNSDVVICETKFPEEKYRELAIYLKQLKSTVRLLTYEDLDMVYSKANMKNPFQRFANNHVNDRFYTSWASNYGYRFHLWRKKENNINVETKEYKQ